MPLHWSSVQGLPSEVHAVPLVFFASAGHAPPAVPGQFSATSHSPPAVRHTKLLDCTTSAGQLALVRAHTSSRSPSSPEPARQSAFPTRRSCELETLMPSHWSSVQGLPSEVHAVPLVFFASAAHAPPAVPGQFSATSHSPAAPRHTKLLDCTTSAGQLALVPVHTSSGSQASPEPARQDRQGFPAGCWQATLGPSDWSTLLGFPPEVHPVPLVFFASAGHAPPAVPGQFSATSHSPPAVRHTKLLDCTTSAGQLVLVPVHTSSGSQASPEPARHTAPTFPAGCWQATLVPSHWSSARL